MKIPFSKYHGAGNDFIIVNGFEQTIPFSKDSNWIKDMCHRRYGIGADGLIIAAPSKESDFEMIYYNSDGGLGSFCGNGSRCVVDFLYSKNMIDSETRFLASDGLHHAKIQRSGWAEVKMRDVEQIELRDKRFILDTGSPHLVEFVNDLQKINVVADGRKLRNLPEFESEGVNVNFVERIGSTLKMATYERGVENETYSCGTGVIAAAITDVFLNQISGDHTVEVLTKGGGFQVRCIFQDNRFEHIWLCGPTACIFDGILDYDKQ